MQGDCEAYVDPDEDEVFFGSVSDQEKSLCAKINARSESGNEYNLVLSSIFVKRRHCEEEDAVNLNKQLVSQDIKLSPLNKDMENSLNNSYQSCENVQDSNKISSNNSVELEHNYSTSMKEKIDKTILATPNSVVKADRDGGFLKVLSEIALVKAEVDACKEIDEKDDNKENKIVPEINIIAATPEKLKLSPPPDSISFQQRKHRCICSTPKLEGSQKIQNLKFTNANNENFKAIENKCMNHFINSLSEEVKTTSESNKISQSQSIHLIELDKNKKEFDAKKVLGSFSKKLNDFKTEEFEKTSSKYVVDQSKTKLQVLEEIDIGTPAEVFSQKNKPHFIADNEADLIDLDGEHKTKPTRNPDLISKETDDSGQQYFNTSNLIAGMDDSLKREAKYENNYLPLTSSQNPQMQCNSQRFSKDAKEIIEMIKKSAVNDTLNFTVQELDVENIENSFLSPKADSFLNDTITPEKDKKTPALEEPISKNTKKVQKVEKSNITLVLPQNKFQSQKCFSDKKVNSQIQIASDKCIKKLAKEIGAIRSTGNIKERKEKESNLLLSSRIPVFDFKSSKLQEKEHIQSSAKTLQKTPLGKVIKNPKFDNIESPISAYIHNKPTSLILNVKSEGKKENLEKVWKNQKSWSEKKAKEKPADVGSLKNAPRLPFVEYKSGASYEIEKQTESRLPRLAPNFQKLIGIRSPKVLKHQGRFYLKTPRRPGLPDDCTVVAEPNEVSLVVSQDAGKNIKKATF